MRRILACLLLAAFGLPVAAPALTSASGASSNLPACCRRNGAHHCAMTIATPTSPAVTAICPHFPQPASSAPIDTSAVTAHPAPHLALHLYTLSPIQQAEAARRIARQRSNQKRGPPSVLPS